MATINGTPGNDTLSGTSGNDTINGFGGNDLFLARANGGSDFIHGGTGTDSIDFRERATSAIVVDFVAGTISGGGSGTMSFTGIERVVASNFNDSLSGNAAAQTLTGQAGADALWGAGGVDTLWGGSGADTFIFREVGTANADRINDWASGSDTLVLDGSVMSALGANGDFAAGDVRFWSYGLGGNDLFVAGSTGGGRRDRRRHVGRTRSSSRSGRRARWSSTSAPAPSAAAVRGRSASRAWSAWSPATSTTA